MTWPTWTCTFSDGAYDIMLKKQWAVAFTWQTAWQNTIWKSPVEVTQFPQHPTVNLKYLGVTLDRSLTHTKHLSQLSMKVNARCNLLRGLAGTKWGAHFDILQTSTTALAFAPAEYCSPVWCRSAHTHRLDAALNNGLRLVSRCIRSTPTFILPVVSGTSA